MRPKLKRLRFTDLYDGLPVDLERFGEAVELEIGDERTAASDTFSAMVCSPSWLSDECRRRGPIWGCHFLIGSRFDQKAVQAAVEEFCAGCAGDSWDDVANQLQRLADWEFASYDAKGQSTSSGSFGKLVAVDCGGSDLSDYRPDRLDLFRLPLRVTLGDARGHTVDFDLTICTPDQVLEPRDKFVLGYGLLFVADYDPARILEAIKRRVERIWGDSSDDLVKKMAQYAPQRS